MNTKTNTHPQSNPAIQNQDPSPPSRLEKAILLQQQLFSDYLDSLKNLPLTKEDFKDISTILYKLTSSHLQFKSLELKFRELHLKEEAHKLKYYQPLQNFPSFAPPLPLKINPETTVLKSANSSPNVPANPYHSVKTYSNTL